MKIKRTVLTTALEKHVFIYQKLKTLVILTNIK